MPEKFSVEEAKELIGLSRRAISYYLAAGTPLSEQAPSKRFEKKQGIFVTLHSFPKNELRGCVGLPYPTNPLWSATIHAATSAAFGDNRFMPLTASELDKVIVEISILSEPQAIKCGKKELPEKIEIGKDGLIVQRGERSGLLLPQVAPELKWNAKEFLEHTCSKAFLPTSAWRDAKCGVFKFQAQIFKEETPNGNVVEVKE